VSVASPTGGGHEVGDALGFDFAAGPVDGVALEGVGQADVGELVHERLDGMGGLEIAPNG
jgi:hypothetical protein